MGAIGVFGLGKLTVPVDTATAAAASLVAAAGAGRIIHLVAFYLTINDVNRIALRDGSTEYIVIDAPAAGVWQNRAPEGHSLMRTSANAALQLVLGSAVRVSGSIEYFVTDAAGNYV